MISFGFMTNAFAWKISSGTVTMNDPTVTAGFQTVSFTGSFFDVASVVFVLPRNLEAEPRALRIHTVTTTGDRVTLGKDVYWYRSRFRIIAVKSAIDI